jgi:hypothetical protein
MQQVFELSLTPLSFHLCSKQAQPSSEVHIQIMPKRTQYLTDCATYLKQLFRIKLSGHSSERLHHWPCHSISQTANRTQSTIMSDARASRLCRPSQQLIKSAWFREDTGMCALVEQLAKYMEEHILSTQARQGRFRQEWILGQGFQDGAPELQNRRSEATKQW